MNRREFSKRAALLGVGLPAGSLMGQAEEPKKSPESWYEEPAKRLPIRKFDVVIAGGGTAGIVAALAAARTGAKTMLIERRGYPGGTYGIPYKALRVAGLENLLAAGMLITSNHDAHMSTRITVCRMGQGQAAGAAALCAARSCGTRELPYAALRESLLKAGVHLES